MGPDDILAILARWIHIASIVVLLGGSVFAWMAAAEGRNLPWEKWKRVVRAAVILAAVSGIRNLLVKGAVPPGYHAIFGIKFLLALHVLAVGLIAAKPDMDGARRKRLLGGVVASGMVTVLLSAYLRWLAQ
jgi:xanthine/uracil permease